MMNIVEAVRQAGKNGAIRRSGRSMRMRRPPWASSSPSVISPDTWISVRLIPELMLTLADFQACDWEVKPKTVKITLDELSEALKRARTNCVPGEIQEISYPLARQIAKELGLL